ncbi:putative transposase-like protein [Trichonephila clavipes]|nr:putative transposase-like protein [Trichonephila clavipes]
MIAKLLLYGGYLSEIKSAESKIGRKVKPNLCFDRIGLWSGRVKNIRRNCMTRERVKNREGSLGYPGFVKPVFTKDSKPLGKRKRSLGDCDTRTHLKKILDHPVDLDLGSSCQKDTSKEKFNMLFVDHQKAIKLQELEQTGQLYQANDLHCEVMDVLPCFKRIPNRSSVKEENHHVSRSARTGSGFELSMLVMQKFIGRCPQKYAVTDLGVGSPTAVDWSNFCREVCLHALIRDSCRIGGVDAIVVVNESKFGKMKYGRGRPMKGKWVFGGTEGNSNKFFFSVVPCQTKECLLAVIKEWVLPGTRTISDCCASYNCLEHESFQHLKVNHSLTFVYPVTGAHTIIALTARGVESNVSLGIRRIAPRTCLIRICMHLRRRKIPTSLRTKPLKGS